MKQCSICEKGSQLKTRYKKLRGHFNPTVKTRVYPNLQWVTPPGKENRIKACVKCIKTIYQT